MSMGMTYSEFWEGDVALPKFYRESYKLMQEREAERANFNAWLQGIYNTKAFSVVLGNAFAKEGSPPLEYFDKPIELRKNDEKPMPESVEPTPEEVELARVRMAIALDNFVNFYKQKKDK